MFGRISALAQTCPWLQDGKEAHVTDHSRVPNIH